MKDYTPKRKDKDLAVVNYIESHRINLNSNESDLGNKINFLTDEMGWKNLRTSSGFGQSAYSSIYNCSPERLTAVVKKTYNESVKRLDKYESSITKIKQYTQLEFDFGDKE
jgi:hypothetical protein